MTGVAHADHRKGTYGNHGYVWFAHYNDFAVADVTSSYATDAVGGQPSADTMMRTTMATKLMAASWVWRSGLRWSRATSTATRPEPNRKHNHAAGPRGSPARLAGDTEGGRDDRAQRQRRAGGGDQGHDQD